LQRSDVSAQTAVLPDAATPPDVAAPAGTPIRSEMIALPNPSGLHTRPATALASLARRFQSDIRILANGKSINAKSPVGLMKLGIRCGDMLQLSAQGTDACAAIADLAALVAAGCGDELAPPTPVALPSESPAAAPDETDGTPALKGICASPGLVVGRVVQVRRRQVVVDDGADDPAVEEDRLACAIVTARRQIDALAATAAGVTQTEILAAHRALLDDPDLIGQPLDAIRAGASAGAAWRNAYTAYADDISRLQDEVLRQRADDIRDVGDRVLSILADRPVTPITAPQDAILVTTALTPSDTIGLDRTRILGFCCTEGGATSHVAILARSLGLPAVCGMDAAVLDLPDGTPVILDGSRGRLLPDPQHPVLEDACRRIEHQRQRQAEEQALAGRPAHLADGTRIAVAANIRNAQEAQLAMQSGAEGVGLLRTEFLFDNRSSAPSEGEQAAQYAAIAAAVGRSHPLVVRTLDVGGDKPLPFLPLPPEDNPFLGLRGVRVSLAYPDLFRAQLRAILTAAPLTGLHVMFPMVATLEDFWEARRILAEEQRQVPAEVKVGVMIEVPSAALLADQLAPEVDFFSIGTNDLTQYVLAMDRGHPRLARQADALHPAVLKLIAMTVDGAHRHGKWVGVCGSVASDPLAAPALVGLGIDELSVSIPAIAAVKATLARLDRPQCRTLASRLLAMRTADDVRDALLPLAT